jgi:hypothetical protein
VCQTTLPVSADAAELPPDSSRSYAVLESLDGRFNEVVNAVPAATTEPPSTTSSATHTPGPRTCGRRTTGQDQT